MNSGRSGPWIVAVAAVAAATGVVVGQLARGGSSAATPPPSTAPPFQLGEAAPPQPGTGGSGPSGAPGFVPVLGLVRSVDTAAGQILVSAPGDMPAQRVRVTPQTLIVRQSPGKAADLKLGDTVAATGTPRELVVREARALQISPGTLARAGAEEQGGLSSLLGAPIGSGGGFARVQGKVTSLNPLRIALNEGIECTLSLAPNANVARIAETTLADLRPGDSIMGVGQPDPDGTLTARQLGVGFALPFGSGDYPGGPGGGLRRRLRGTVP